MQAANVHSVGPGLHKSNRVIITATGNGSYGCCDFRDGGPATDSQLGFPTGVAVHGMGNLFIATSGDGEGFFNNHESIRNVSAPPSGIIGIIAGDFSPGFSGDGGPVGFVRLRGKAGLAVDAVGYVYVADSGNRLVRILASQNADPISPGEVVVIYPAVLARCRRSGTSQETDDWARS